MKSIDLCLAALVAFAVICGASYEDLGEKKAASYVLLALAILVFGLIAGALLALAIVRRRIDNVDGLVDAIKTQSTLLVFYVPIRLNPVWPSTKNGGLRVSRMFLSELPYIGIVFVAVLLMYGFYPESDVLTGWRFPALFETKVGTIIIHGGSTFFGCWAFSYTFLPIVAWLKER